VFVAVFSVFVVAMVVLVVFIVRWSIRRDRERRAAQPPVDKAP
jgi:heme/copper-type cytochrome/quinol oxidase subunit 2